MLIEGSGSTDTGKRARNEDALAVRPQLGLYLVSDGMGGYAGGAVASKLVVETVVAFLDQNARDPDVTWPFVTWPEEPSAGAIGFEESRVLVALRLAHREIVKRRHGELAQMGATAAMVLTKHDRAIIAHVGDSRVYRLREGKLEQLTRDHSFLEEVCARGQDLGEEERARIAAQYGHVITRAMGNDRELEPDLRSVELRSGDVLMLCTDGVHGALGADEMRDILAMHAPSDAADLLISRAIDEGSTDNVTAVVLRAR